MQELLADKPLQQSHVGYTTVGHDDDNDTMRTTPQFARPRFTWPFSATSREDSLREQVEKQLHDLALEKDEKKAMAKELDATKVELGKSKLEIRRLLVDNSFHERYS